LVIERLIRQVRALLIKTAPIAAVHVQNLLCRLLILLLLNRTPGWVCVAARRGNALLF
jgi:hypothetical protein